MRVFRPLPSAAVGATRARPHAPVRRWQGHRVASPGGRPSSGGSQPWSSRNTHVSRTAVPPHVSCHGEPLFLTQGSLQKRGPLPWSSHCFWERRWCRVLPISDFTASGECVCPQNALLSPNLMTRHLKCYDNKQCVGNDVLRMHRARRGHGTLRLC